MAKNLDRWLLSWLLRRRTRLPATRHVFIAVCDHFEPFHHASKALALERVQFWQREFPKLTAEFRDSGGIPPRHTFFYPTEQWDNDICSCIADLCRNTGAEIEIQLHHHRDTAENLTNTLELAKARLDALGFLACDRERDKLPAFGFVHGNWALDHSHPKGRACGVPDELAVLRRAGCYADFTLPSAPSRCQVPMINALYYAREDGQPRSHARGTRVHAGYVRAHSDDELLLITGPLGLNWRWRKWGILPRIENADLTHANPPTAVRLRVWENCHVHVRDRPDWIFIKLHTHGAIESNRTMLLGEPMRAFHRHLRDRAAQDPGFHFHYVTAREMANLVHAAEASEPNQPHHYRNYRYRLNKPPSPAPVPSKQDPRSAQNPPSDFRG